MKSATLRTSIYRASNTKIIAIDADPAKAECFIVRAASLRDDSPLTAEDLPIRLFHHGHLDLQEENSVAIASVGIRDGRVRLMADCGDEDSSVIGFPLSGEGTRSIAEDINRVFGALRTVASIGLGVRMGQGVAPFYRVNAKSLEQYIAAVDACLERYLSDVYSGAIPNPFDGK